MQMESPAFADHKVIPTRYTCEGEDRSPPLIFKEIPSGTVSLALIMDDPDAPRGTFDHWIVWNIPPTTNNLPEAAKVPKQGTNHFNEKRYRGPCPPPGKPHRYFFKLYALDTMIQLPEGATKEQLEKAMEGHVLGRAELVGTYQRSH